MKAAEEKNGKKRVRSCADKGNSVKDNDGTNDCSCAGLRRKRWTKEGEAEMMDEGRRSGNESIERVKTKIDLYLFQKTI